MADILILGSEADVHVKMVSKKLDILGVRNFVIDYKNLCRYKLHINAEAKLTMYCENEKVSPVLLWDRVKIYPRCLGASDEEISEYFYNSEWKALYEDISYVYKHIAVNDFASKIMLNRKLNQMITAGKLGFRVPLSLITNEKATAYSFLRESGRSIVKVIGTPQAPLLERENEGKIIYSQVMTNEVSIDDVDNLNEQSFNCPSIMQKYIDKKKEFRVNIIGENCYAFYVDYCGKEYAMVDWRWGGKGIKMIPCDIPDDIVDKLLKFLEEYRLCYGVFDLIECTNGDFYFLECNPEGQWAALDPLVDGKISDAMAAILLSKSRERAVHIAPVGQIQPSEQKKGAEM